MDKEKNIKQELLKQMDKDSIEADDASLNAAGKTIKKHRAQVRRLKWITAISWLFAILYAVVMHNLKVFLLKNDLQNVLNEDKFWLVRHSDTGLIVLVIIAVLLTYLVYSKSKTLTMLQICSRLANIENYLKKISQDR